MATLQADESTPREAPRAFNRHMYHDRVNVFYGTDDGAQDGSFSEFEEFEEHYRGVAPQRREDIHMVSVVGGLYGLNLMPLWRPKKITIFDINPTAVAYFRVVRRLFQRSADVAELLDHFTHGDYEVDDEEEAFVRENIRLKQAGQLPRSRGSSKRSYEESWTYAFRHFDLTKSILTDVPLDIRCEPMEAPSFHDWIKDQNNLWIYCSNITQFHFFDLEFSDPSNVVLLQIIFPEQPQLLDLARFAPSPAKVRLEIPMVAEPIAGRWPRTPRGVGAPTPDALQPATPAEAPAPVPADAGTKGAQGAPPAPPAPGAAESPSDSLDERLREHFHTAWYAGELWKEIAWFGLPIRKHPFDLFQYQEIISQQRPEFVIECGAYLGGSTLYFAHLLDLVGHGTVISIELANCWEPRVLAHPRVRALAGSSVDPQILSRVRQLVPPGASCFVILDSDHRAEHVLAELRAYQEFVQVGNYLVVEDTNLNGHPVLPGWGPGPFEAVEAFLKEDASFVPDRWRERKLFMTFAPSGWLRRVP